MKMSVDVVSLFDGISCGMVALERAGIDVNKYYAYEIDQSAITISKKNYPQIIRMGDGDVFHADYSEILRERERERERERPLILIGGSPCTHWSIANKNRTTVCEGLGWDLFMQYVRAMNELNPDYFLYENNYRISTPIRDTISHELDVEPIMINSALVSAQSRKRYYWTSIPITNTLEDKQIYFGDILCNDRLWKPLGKWVYSKWGNDIKLNGLKSIDSPKSNTITTNKTHPRQYYLNRDKTRYTNLTPEEYEALQTLPEGYTSGVSNVNRYKLVANGWTVDVIAHIFKGLL